VSAPTQRRGKKTINGINMTPFVDIVLVLLVILMMTTKLVSDSRGIKVTLPSAQSAEKHEREKVLSLTINAEGVMLVDGEVISEASFEKIVPRAKAAERVRIAADGDAPHRAVVRAMDLFGRAGVTQLSFAVSDEKK
jgi:biopolymer transport protein ExbD